MALRAFFVITYLVLVVIGILQNFVVSNAIFDEI
jgi:hypothetical protein